MNLRERLEKNIIFNKLNETEFKSKVLNLWDFAEHNIHPFQKGDSHQGSIHCYNVINNLGKIHLDNLDPLSIYLLCCSAILHDIDKAIIDHAKHVGSRHGRVSAEFIRSNPSLFHFSKPVAEAIAIITEYHGKVNQSEIKHKYPSEQIKDPIKYKKYGNINYALLSSIFKLSDMMDVSYKRISDIIIKLNFPEKCDSPKLLSRQLLKEATADRHERKIILDSYTISSPMEYQAVIIAVDMMNEELADTGVADALNIFGYPYKFSINNLPINNDVNKFIADRKEISDFNLKNWRLKIQDKDEDKIRRIFIKNRIELDFSPSEYIQLESKYNFIYSELKKKPVKEISNELFSTFGYSIDKMILERTYYKNGNISEVIRLLGI
jgi:hypothetical protein